MHANRIIGFSLHAKQKLCTSCSRHSDATRLIDEPTSLDILTAADSSRIVEDEQDDETTESTQLTSAEKRKKAHKDESAKVLRALLPITASSHASSLRLDDETQEQLARSSKQARTTKTGVETLPDVSFLFQKGHCEHQRNGFLQVRMAGMRRSNKKKLLKKKDGERNLHFASCPLEVQAALRETRRAEWNAGVMLTDEEVRQLTEAGCGIYPMQWIEVDKKCTSTTR